MAAERIPAAAQKGLAGVIGFPVTHSLSPLLHRAWATREGVAADYRPIAADPGYDAFAAAAAPLAAAGYAGVNITLPHKENALRYALSAGGAASESALGAGAANMLSFTPDGPYADNSDIEGFAASVRALEKPGERVRSAVVLGAGGAARGVILGLSSLGCSHVVIANRTRAKADELAARFGVEAADWEARAGILADADILVNATSLGMTGAAPLDLDIGALPAAAIVIDIIYAPLETRLLSAARARGLRAENGLPMLMHQAIPAYKAWLGERAVVDAALRDELEAALAARGAP